MVSWRFANGLHINNLPLLSYDHKIDKALITNGDCKEVILQEKWQIYTRHREINPLEPLKSKMIYYNVHFVHFSELGFII